MSASVADILAARAAGDVVRTALRAALGDDLVEISIRTVSSVDACAGRIEAIAQVTALIRHDRADLYRQAWMAISDAALRDVYGGRDGIPWVARVAPPGTSGPGVLVLVTVTVEPEARS